MSLAAMDKRFHALTVALDSVRSASSFSFELRARVVIYGVGNVTIGGPSYRLGPCEGGALAMAVVGALPPRVE